MISASSLPRSPLSPPCGLRPSTPMRGLSMPKSCSRDALMRRSLLSIFSVVMAPGTSLSGMCPVTTPTLRRCEIMNMVTSLTPKAFSRYSVWPWKPKPASTTDFLFMGPVTSTSMSPFLRSSTARSRHVIAACAESAVAPPGSANTFSGRQLRIFTRFGCASPGLLITLVSICSMSWIVFR